MQLSIKGDLKKLSKKLNDLERKQLPFATAKALTVTAKAVQVATTRQLKQDIDRPTPFTQKAIGMKRATKKNLNSVVFIKPTQAKYLGYQIEGGTRRATNDKPVLIPRKNLTNKYGNLPRKKLANLRSKNKLVVNGSLASQQMARKLKPIAYFAKSATYKRRFKFFERAQATTKKVFKRELSQAIRHAIATAR